MGVKLGRLSLGFLNSVGLPAFMHSVWADRCAEGVGSDDSLYWLAMRPLTLPSASRRLRTLARNDELAGIRVGR